MIAKFLVENGADLSQVDGNGKTAGELAKLYGQTDVAEYLARASLRAD